MENVMFENMSKQPASWLSGKGHESLVVISTRVRLARNIAGCQYPPSADEETKKKVVEYFDSTITRSDMFQDENYFKAGQITRLDKDFLVERHLLSPVFLNGDENKSFFSWKYH